jgi:hypothetical protein
MNIKFLDKVYDQIISETRVIDDKVYTPFLFIPLYHHPLISHLLSPHFFISSFYKHCKEIYSLNEQEIDYVWGKYKKGITTLMEDKEPSHQEKG